MPDTKITALAAITTVDPAADVLPIVDISDTSMAASGTTKKITSNQILGSGGTATLASATITGDLTVDTSTLKVNSANNVVGIINASPLTGTDGGLTLGVIGSSKAMAISMFNCFARLRERDAVNNFAITTNIDTTNAVLDDNTRTSWKVRFGSGNDNFLIQRAAIGSTTFQDLYSISTTSAVWSDGAGGTRMTLNSTGLGVGIVPSSFGRFSVQGTAGGAGILGMNTDATQCDIQAYNKPLALNRAGNNITMCEGGGNVGIGVTPAGTGGCLQLKSGITFPATQVASSDANTLDDYEEGTFTPTIEGITTAGSGTYSNQIGRYTKIGNQVTIWVRLTWSSHTGTGNMVASNFPFTIANVNNLIPSGAIGYTANIAITAGNLLMIAGDSNSSRAFFWQTPTGGGSTSNVPLDTAGDVAFTMTYFV